MRVSANDNAGVPFRIGPWALVFFLLVIAAYWDPVFLKRNFAGRDLLAYNLPMEYAVHDAYSRGRLPVWSADISGGRPLIPNPNVGSLYPARMILSLVPFPLAMRLFPVLHWSLAGIGMILLLRSLGVSLAAAWIGAVTFAFSGVAVSEVYFPHIHPGLSLLPWILWAMQARLRPHWRTLALAALFGLDLLAADVFTIGAAILCVLLWIGLEIEPARRGAAAVEFTIALALGVLLAAPQIVATALWVPQTRRAVLGVKLGDALLYTVSPFRLLEFLVPYPFGPTWSLDYASVWAKSLFRGRSIGLFASLYCNAFALVAAARASRERRPGTRAALGLLVAAILLAVAPSLIPSSLYSVRAPVALRNPEKLAVLFVLGLSILAGLGLDRIRSERSRAPIFAAVVIAGVFAAIGLACQIAPERAGRIAVRAVGANPSLGPLAAAALPGAMAEAGVLWIATALAIGFTQARGRGGVAAGVLLVTGATLAPNCRIAQTYREDEVFAPTAFARAVRRRDPAGSFRVLGESLYLPPSNIASSAGDAQIALSLERNSWQEHTQALWKYGSVLNYDFDSGDLSRVETLRRLTPILGRSPSLANLYGSLSLRWGVRYRDQPPLPGFHRFGGNGIQDWDEMTEAYPDVRFVTRWTEESDARRVPGAIAALAPDEVVLESEATRQGRARPGELTIVEKSPERLVMEARCPDPTWLFVLRGFWDYRSVRIDGREVEVVPAQVAFSAVAVPPGSHRILWQERVPGGPITRWGPVLAVLVSAAWIVRRRST